jgi:hypothetical protein
MRESRPTGYVFRLEKARGASWWAKYQLGSGTQVKKKIGHGPVEDDPRTATSPSVSPRTGSETGSMTVAMKTSP